MKFTLIENAKNPSFVRIERDDQEGRKLISFSKEELLTPLSLFPEEGVSKDLPIVAVLKMRFNKPLGFATWEEARDALETLDRMSALLGRFNLTLKGVLRRG